MDRSARERVEVRGGLSRRSRIVEETRTSESFWRILE
jgi:hypothetical protein